MMFLRASSTSLLLLLVAPLLAAPNTSRNALKNGSFEGSLKYWMLEGSGAAVEPGEVPSGKYLLRLPNGKSIRSASFALQKGVPVRISVWARSGTVGKNGSVQIAIAPTLRELAQESKLAWNFRFKKEVSGEWQRADWEWTPDLEPRGWWQGAYMMWLGGSPGIEIDAISIAPVASSGDAKGLKYLGHGESQVEVASDITNRPGYEKDGNLFARGASVNLQSAVFNASGVAKNLIVRREIVDYEGRARIGSAVEARIALAPNETRVLQQALPLGGAGLMLARTSILENGALLAKSDAPVTILPFPKLATAPNPSERFGGSYRGWANTRWAQAMGFGWARWWQGQKRWKEVQPEENKFLWDELDRDVALLKSHGMSLNWVLWDDVPKWAQSPNGRPRDMDWEPNDPRWADLKIETLWDKHVRALVGRYKAPSSAWEFWNEWDLHKDKAYSDEYMVALANRTGRIVKSVDPTAKYLINATWPHVTPVNRLMIDKHADLVDVFTYHNYTGGALTSPDAIDSMRSLLASKGNPRAEVWFNEGWTYINSSHDYPALPLTNLSPPEQAHLIVRNQADLLAAGQSKTILFHIGYGQHGKSYWDWTGSGTELWDDHNDATVMVPVWNTLADSLGLSRFVGTVRPKGATLHVFHDERNNRGVIIASASSDKAATLRLPFQQLTRRDVMGRDEVLASQGASSTCLLSGDRRPYYLFSQGKVSGEVLLGRLKPLDEREAERAGGAVFRPPFPWAGKVASSSAGNPLAGDGIAPLWRLDVVWPDDVSKAENYKPMLWRGDTWGTEEHQLGGQPAGRSTVEGIALGTRGSWGKGEYTPALSFIAPQAGKYTLSGRAETRVWTGSGPIKLLAMKYTARDKTLQSAKSWDLNNGELDLSGWEVDLEVGDEVRFAARVGKANTAANVLLKEWKLEKK